MLALEPLDGGASGVRGDGRPVFSYPARLAHLWRMVRARDLALDGPIQTG